MKREINPNDFNLAAIDIGSNAARILIKNVKLSTDDDGKPSVRLKKLQFLRIPLRLGMDVFSIGRISEEREKQLMRTMKIFRQLLVIYNVEDYRACATAAFRDAKNGKKILKQIYSKAKLDIEIVTGDEEAKIIRDNHVQEDGKNYLYMDVGGGSTELSLISDGKLVAVRSFNIGTIRLLIESVSTEQWNEMGEVVRNLTEGYENINIIGSGGNINKLHRLTPKREKKKECLMVSTLNKLYNHLSVLSLEERMKQYDLREDRADVIVPAAQLFLMVAGIINTDTIIVPTMGLTDGIINELVEKTLNNR
ncbi:MAG: Ppx/GppA family phosphatase [Prevotellaceae bacterium]|nr:Ppx/GppA family phosphatase [Prevotellaceae bacterium]